MLTLARLQKKTEGRKYRATVPLKDEIGSEKSGSGS
jgi:hypothetical protein